ncbi:MAG: SUMF1/EgtB/PvdO family nonheme iron enzyme, partial [Lentimicrobiaceae bacterium]|nr:SUMF1/EgtB/PvdO family nonheme iron enzyme [Lentimicrobiaceae bacterium]
CYTGERPTHKVTLPDFFMGEFQVTQKLWHAVMGANLQQQWLAPLIAERSNLIELARRLKSSTITVNTNTFWDIEQFTPEDYNKVIPVYGEGNNYPIYYITYTNCEIFCSRLNQLLSDQLPEDYKFRMPTEAQWEYAARGGKMSKGYTFSGSNHIDEVAWYNVNSEEKTHEVGKKIKNELGIYDMSGNVWEWCRDRYSESYYSNSPAVNPKGPDKGSEYVLRGGSWDQNEWACRNAARHKDDPDAYTANYGFRLVLEPPSKLSAKDFLGHNSNSVASRISLGRNLTFKVNDVEFEMIFVEGEKFVMGCSSKNMDCDTIEKPSHYVTLSNYFMGKFEITQKLWYAVMGTTIREQRDLANTTWEIYGEGEQYPIYYVSYENCEEFCEKLNLLLSDQLPEGFTFRLPTEAQWEYAARGGKKSKNYTYSGSNRIDRIAWWVNNSEKKASKVGSKFENELGIHDMSGNVWEWCRDWFDDHYYSYGSATNPQGALSGTQRVLRGGSWNLKPWTCRVTTRHHYKPESCSANVGFRIVLVSDEEIFDLKSFKDAISKLSPQISSTNNHNFKFNEINFDMVFVEGGTFTMGCTSNPNDCFANEEPTHSVTLSDFYIGKFQVTQQLWEKVMGTTLHQQRNLLDSTSTLKIHGEGSLYPIYFINYKECEAFCEKLNQLFSQQLPEGYKFSLPTEAQWEYAARGGKKSKGYIYSGSDNISKVAWHDDNSNEQIHQIGMKKKNELGIHDMSGNVWEWCRDWFEGEYYNYSPSTDPTGPAYGYHRALRGGSWRSIAQGCRISCRFKSSPNERASNCGLRVALVKERNER